MSGLREIDTPVLNSSNTPEARTRGGGKGGGGGSELTCLSNLLCNHSALLSPSPSPSQADWYNHAMRLVDVSTGLVTTLAGNYLISGGPPYNYGHSDGVGAAASFYYPTGVSLNSAGTLAIVVSEN